MTDNIAVVTGAGSGIGKATALAFAMQGDKVIAADLDLDAANRTSECFPDSVFAMGVDIADRETVDQLRERVHSEVRFAASRSRGARRS